MEKKKKKKRIFSRSLLNFFPRKFNRRVIIKIPAFNSINFVSSISIRTFRPRTRIQQLREHYTCTAWSGFGIFVCSQGERKSSLPFAS